MRILREQAIFTAIDYQEKLLPIIENQEEIVRNTTYLLQGLSGLKVPSIMTTQYQKGLGKNISSIRHLIGDENNFDKNTFSIYRDPLIRNYLQNGNYKYILIGGTETHICVLQSMIDLKEAGFMPVLVTDCTGSRKKEEKQIALLRAQQEGILLTTSESLLYELTLTASDPFFKTLTALVKDKNSY